ncbi:plasmid partitioning protein RepB [Chenggangzhangella methanolivorans]|nr:plasmid partitioning protein RepB [Chenggangzhangella methanolivorans]
MAEVIELAPEVIDPSFVSDRLTLDQDLDFVEFIRQNGQQAPILVRPHPEHSGRFQAVYGHRRLAAASALGTKVSAIVRTLSDVELVVAQGQENAARKDLSFIERALFAMRLEQRGFDRQTIMSALIVDKADLSRLISIASRAPRELLEAIGPAPKAGRQRWEALIACLEAPDGLKKARSFAKSKMFQTLYSDERFSELLERLQPVRLGVAGATDIVVDDDPIGSIKATKSATTFRFETAAAPEFAAYLADQLGDIYRNWKKTHSA